jgi:hypothetical protein
MIRRKPDHERKSELIGLRLRVRDRRLLELMAHRDQVGNQTMLIQLIDEGARARGLLPSEEELKREGVPS